MCERKKKKKIHKTPDSFQQFEKAEQLSSIDEDKREKQPREGKTQAELASPPTVNMGRKKRRAGKEFPLSPDLIFKPK